MARIPIDVINDIKHRARIEDIIGSFITVIKQGANYVAYCPFHDDHDPSLHISTDKQIFKCFSCPAENKTAGDVFSFVMKYKKISYPEAVKTVADMIGYKYEFSDSYKDKFEETIYHKIISDTVIFCQNELNSASGLPYKEYLTNRKLDKEVLRKYAFGYNPPRDKLYNFLNKKGYKDDDLIKANVVRLTENGIRDVFYDRIMIPIFDEYSHPIAFTARSIDKNATSKYINSADTPIYHKSDVLFDLNFAKDYIKEKKMVILAEGPMDVIAFDRAGIKNATCSLGTNLTDKQLSLLKKYTDKVLLAFDGDTAGQGAILRAGKMAEKIGFNVVVINNRTGLDPDEIINKYGSEELQSMVSKPLNWLDFIINYYRNQFDLKNYSEKKEFVNKVIAEINLLTDELDKDLYLRKLAEISGFSYDILSRKNGNYTTVYSKNEFASKQNSVEINNGLDIAQRTILKQLMLSAANVSIFQDEMIELPDEKYNKFITLIINSYSQNPQFKIASLVDTLDDEDYSLLLSILADKSTLEKPNSSLLKDCCIKIKISHLQNEKQKISREIEKINDGHLKGKLSTNYINIQKEINSLKQKLSTTTGGKDYE